jgi:F0F1-type ATP synthase assembly protein I
MKKTSTPEKKTPSPAVQAKPHAAVGNQTSNPSSVFIGAALDMSWRLAIVVLLPIIGGFELDQHLHMSPFLTIVGFLLAMGGMALVLWQTLQQVNQLTTPKQEKHS